MLGVKLAAQGRHAAARDGHAAASAQAALDGVVVERAEQSAVQLHEAAVREGLPALLGGSRAEGCGGGDTRKVMFMGWFGGVHGV